MLQGDPKSPANRVARPRSRIATGFHRIGLTLATFALIVSVPFLIGEYNYPSGSHKKWENLSDNEKKLVRNNYEIREINRGKDPLPETNIFWMYDDEAGVILPRSINLYIFLYAILIAVLSYAGCWALGWILDGFTGAPRQ